MKNICFGIYVGYGALYTWVVVMQYAPVHCYAVCMQQQRKRYQHAIIPLQVLLREAEDHQRQIYGTLKID